MRADLTLKRVPWNLFFAGTVFAAAGFFLVYHLLAGDLQDLSIFKGDWWQWAIALGLLSLSAVVVLAGHVETVTFSLTDQTVTVCRYLPLWASSSESHRLHDLQDVIILQKGQLTRFENTVRYYVLLQMKWGRRIKTLETRSVRSIKEKATEIREYLGMKGETRLTR